MEDDWNLIDMKQKIFQQAEESASDTEARAAVITGIDAMIRATLRIEKSRELSPIELAILIECPDWLMMCEEVVYG